MSHLPRELFAVEIDGKVGRVEVGDLRATGRLGVGLGLGSNPKPNPTPNPNPNPNPNPDSNPNPDPNPNPNPDPNPKQEGVTFDVVYTSWLSRAIETVS